MAPSDENVSFLRELQEKKKRKPLDAPYLEESDVLTRLEKAPQLGPFNCVQQCKFK